MIADVRFKVRMRLRALIETLRNEYDGNRVLRADFGKAKHDAETALRIKGRYRSRIKEAFPGCEVTCTPTRILIYLPLSYPRPGVPVSEPYPARLTPGIFGVPAQPDF